MGSFLLFILVIFFAIIGLIGAFVLKFVRLFTKQTSSSHHGRSTNNRYEDQQSQHADNDSNHQKIFSKEEGEYIDYEEVK
ncbi:DUF4834 family protein [Dysgonomonas sp. HDW5B]|uniref:DUF4834 family protein n=1 Tax=Dysgonomonas sp. HDW5B TaxID=2714927 RepID=UPI00140D70A0|nr:DUF4834 family protein [Dysgonomonas sp. HDW5B]QIK54643.1 DUF4834 family protein [Dysgonomonas sp. HDW5B]